MLSLDTHDSIVALYGGRPRILIVDDEPHNRHLLGRLFANYADISEVTDGAEALEKLANESFDIVLLDVMMPGVNGIEVLRQIRCDERLEDLPVILITAMNQSQDIATGLRHGANDYITKPVALDVVIARVNTQLKMKKIMDINKRAIVELESAQRMKDRLLRIASHDLKSPLSNIRMSEALLREMFDAPEALEVLDMMKLTADHMHDIIEDFLDLAAYQNGVVAVELAPVVAREVIGQIARQYEPVANKKQITLNITNVDGVVHADVARLQQALSNLISNAIKYSPPGSTVSICATPSGDMIRFSVADQGPGIPPEERHLLFTEFGKLTPRPTGTESSTGLGLWIVKQVTAIQGGRVGADFPPDGGSVFWLELPVSAD
ncbi:MAG: hybrid sensor histidine kinase/response regulator [Anaerolineaceae bacterium]|nr:MAG: hybrid sensor histidine kinase/response regulator [Anaerolineaceae bacterium]